MKIAITGHRPNKLGNDYDLTSPLVKKLKEEIRSIVISLHIESGMLPERATLITGMALGIDTLFAQIAIEHNLKFIAAIPCANHSSKWPEKSRKEYNRLITHPLCYIWWVSKKPYSRECMQKRNEWMVDNCDVLIAVWDGSSGGTANCVKYAEKQGKKIIYINPKNYENLKKTV